MMMRILRIMIVDDYYVVDDDMPHFYKKTRYKGAAVNRIQVQ